jgi:hypothetical protein
VPIILLKLSNGEILTCYKRRHCGRLILRQGQDNYLLLLSIYARSLHSFRHIAANCDREWICLWRVGNSYDINRTVRNVFLLSTIIVNI